MISPRRNHLLNPKNISIIKKQNLIKKKEEKSWIEQQSLHQKQQASANDPKIITTLHNCLRSNLHPRIEVLKKPNNVLSLLKRL